MKDFNYGKGFEGIAKVTEAFIEQKGITDALGDASIGIGLSRDSKFSVPDTGKYRPAYVGDSSFVGKVYADEQTKAVMASDSSSVETSYVYNMQTQKFDATIKAGRATDASPFTNAQAIAPWNASWFSQMFKQPLLYSNLKKFVNYDNGSDPWAEVMSLHTSQYSGFGAISEAGQASNNMNIDINNQAGIMTTPIINMFSTYALDIVEQQRASVSNTPFGGQMIADKQKYAKYVLDIMEDYIGWYGNAATGTVGLLSVNNITAWSGIGSSMSTIATGASTSKGSDMMTLIYKAINDFLVTNQNLFNTIRIAVSPTAYNILSSIQYSANYNPEPPISTIQRFYAAGKGAYDRPVDVQFVVEPMLSATTSNIYTNVFNSNSYDYMVITAPTIRLEQDNAEQKLIMYGTPVKDFVYPVIPGAYNTEYKQLKRVAGIFAPVGTAVKAYSGFGI